MTRERSSTDKPIRGSRSALALMVMAHEALTPPWKGKPLPILKSWLGPADPSRFPFEVASHAYQLLVELLVLNLAGDQLPGFWFVEKDKTITALSIPRERLTSEDEFLGVFPSFYDQKRGAQRIFGCFPRWGKSHHAPLGEAPDTYWAIISDRYGRYERLELSLRPLPSSDRLEMGGWLTLQAFDRTEPAAPTARDSCLARPSTT